MCEREVAPELAERKVEKARREGRERERGREGIERETMGARGTSIHTHTHTHTHIQPVVIICSWCGPAPTTHTCRSTRFTSTYARSDTLCVVEL